MSNGMMFLAMKRVAHQQTRSRLARVRYPDREREPRRLKHWANR